MGTPPPLFWVPGPSQKPFRESLRIFPNWSKFMYKIVFLRLFPQPARTRKWRCFKMHFLPRGEPFQNCNRIDHAHPLWFTMDIWRMTFRLENRGKLTKGGIHMAEWLERRTLNQRVVGSKPGEGTARYLWAGYLNSTARGSQNKLNCLRHVPLPSVKKCTCQKFLKDQPLDLFIADNDIEAWAFFY
jgi:hypothetical protein